MADRVPYDEMALFHENAAEFGIPYPGPPVVRREHVDLGDGRRLSALVWGEEPPELVLLHGGAQNAHTWDTVALALDRPLVAIDLPGHGHSDGAGAEGSLDLRRNAADVALTIEQLGARGAGGGRHVARGSHHDRRRRRPPGAGSVRRAGRRDTQGGWAWRGGDRRLRRRPRSFADFDELLARTMEFNPTRSESSLRRGILHNALQLEDGSWVWRYRRFTADAGGAPCPPRSCGTRSGRIAVPVMLVRGMRAGSVVDDDAEAELPRRLPTARVEHVAEAGHSVQGDDPLRLAELLRDFCSLG